MFLIGFNINITNNYKKVPPPHVHIKEYESMALNNRGCKICSPLIVLLSGPAVALISNYVEIFAFNYKHAILLCTLDRFEHKVLISSHQLACISNTLFEIV